MPERHNIEILPVDENVLAELQARHGEAREILIHRALEVYRGVIGDLAAGDRLLVEKYATKELTTLEIV